MATIFRERGGLYLAETPNYGYLFRRYRPKGYVVVTEIWGSLHFCNKGWKRLGTIPIQRFERALKDEYPESRLMEIVDELREKKKQVRRE